MRGIQSSSKREQRLKKYLKPGALAQLRDARIHARSQTFIAARKLSVVANAEPSGPTRANQPNQPQASIVDETPCFKVRSFGPCCPQRKKLMASKAFFFAITPGSPSSPTGTAGMVEAIDTFSPPVDILAVH